MKAGILRVRKNGKGETVFEVHLWPNTTGLPRICSSVCAEQEKVDLDPKWAGPNDAAEISERLAAPKKGATTGRTKGRVLYLIHTTPLKGKHRVEAVALMSVEKPSLFKLYRICFNDDVTAHDRDLASVELVRCAMALAGKAGAHLHMRVPPGRKAGEIKQAYGFTKTVKDGYGNEWVVR